MVGSALVRQLERLGYENIITRSRAELDLCSQNDVIQFFESHPIDQVYLAAAKVGGILANSTYPAEFIHENLCMQSNIIHAAHKAGVDRLLFLGSSCIYPKHASQPMHESELLTGPLETTNEAYAVAKIAGLKMCEAYSAQYGRQYRSVMPTNLYGEGDNFHPENSHVIPGLMNRFKSAIESGDSSMSIWGSGSPKREFLHVDDMAAASIHVMNLEKNEFEAATSGTAKHINVGVGGDCSIKELAELLKETTGFEGTLEFDVSKPDGTPRKLLDVSRLHGTGWTHEIDLPQGLKRTWDWFLNAHSDVRT